MLSSRLLDAAPCDPFFRAAGRSDSRNGAGAGCHGDWRDQGDTRNRAWTDGRDHTREDEKHEGQQTCVSANQPRRPMREEIERPVRFRDREQKRDARERDEQVRRKGGDHRLRFHVRGVDADEPRERDAEEPDVDARRHAQPDREEQREKRENGWRDDHFVTFVSSVRAGAFSGGRRCFCTFPSAVRGSASTRAKARGTLNDAS